MNQYKQKSKYIMLTIKVLQEVETIRRGAMTLFMSLLYSTDTQLASFIVDKPIIIFVLS